MVLVALRPVEDGDLGALFEQMRDPEGVQMAAFTAEDPDDRHAFDAHMARVRRFAGHHLEGGDLRWAPRREHRQLPVRGPDRGHPLDGSRALGEGHRDPGPGAATETGAGRPLYALAASDNAGSLRVLRKCGFQPIGTEKSFAAGRNEDIKETILRLDASRPHPTLFCRRSRVSATCWRRARWCCGLGSPWPAVRVSRQRCRPKLNR